MRLVRPFGGQTSTFSVRFYMEVKMRRLMMSPRNRVSVPFAAIAGAIALLLPLRTAAVPELQSPPKAHTSHSGRAHLKRALHKEPRKASDDTSGNRGLLTRDVKDSKQDLKRARERPDADEPMEAMKWRRLSQVDENGQIPDDAWTRAIEQRAMNGGVMRPQGGPPPLAWVERGPRNVTGRSRTFLIHPTQKNRMWTAGVGGGIWYSSDGGVNWAPVNDYMSTLAVNCMTMDPTDPNIMYAGTGEGYFNGDAINGEGLFKSTDGGLSWSQLTNTANFNGINRVAVSPANHNIILMSTNYGGINRSADGGQTWTATHWAQVGMSAAFSPSDATKAVASVLDYDFNTNQWFHQALYSTDSGQTWTVAAGDLGKSYGFTNRIELAYAPSNTLVVYASSALNGGIVYKSIDGGHSYTPVTTSGTTGASWYCNAIWVDPANSNFLVVCGFGTYKSINGGATITPISSGYILTTQPHPDNHYIIAMPGFNGVTNKTLFVTTDGGPFRTDDIYSASVNSGWGPVGAQRTTQYYGAAGDGPTGKILGGLQDNGTLLTVNGNDNASLEFGGDGGYCAIDWTDTHYLYGEYVNLQIHRSTDGGVSAGYITSGLGDAGYSANFIAPFILDPNNVNRLLAGGTSLWRCNNAKAPTPTWTAIRSAASQPISAIAVAPGNSDIVWVGYNDGTIFKTTNGTASSPLWTVVNSGTVNPIPFRYITRILIDPANSSTVYVALGGFTPDNLWKTADGGATWKSLKGQGTSILPSAPIRGIARDPGDPNSLYVGTEVGIFDSSDGGATWSTDEAGPAEVSVDELTFMANSTTLLAATHGRGIWTAELNTVKQFTVSPASQIGGQTLSAVVTLSRIAPPNGMKVSLTSSSATVKPPATVTVPAGQSSYTFTIPTSSVSVQTSVTITAQLGKSSAGANVTLNPGIAVSSLTVTPTSVIGGATASATVAINSAAPSGGASIQLSSSSSAATVPGSVLIPAGSTSVKCSVTTAVVKAAQAVTLTATYHGIATATLQVKPIAVTAVTLSPSSVTTGNTSQGSITLNAPAPTGGLSVALSSSNTAAATVPTAVTVSSGSTTAFFTVTTVSGLTQTQTTTIGATLNSATASAMLTVQPFLSFGLSLTPSTAQGGVTNPVLTLTLTGAAPSGGVTFTLTTSNPSAAAPASATVTIPAGQTVAQVTINTKKVTANQVVSLSATHGPTKKTVTLKVTP